MHLAGRTVIVTGASRGIGADVARSIASSIRMLPAASRAICIAVISGTPLASIVPSIRQKRAAASDRVRGPTTGTALRISTRRRRTVALRAIRHPTTPSPNPPIAQ